MSLDLEQLFQDYLREVVPTPTVRTALRGSWPKFVRFCREQGLETITVTVVEDFYKSLLWQSHERGWYRANSVDQYVRRVRQVLRWAFLEGHLAEDPTEGLLLPRPLQPTRQLLSWEQLEKLLATPDRSTPMGLRDALLLHFLTETGLGLQQVVALSIDNWQNLEIDASTRTLALEYLEKARPLWEREAQRALFLGRTGEPLGAQAAVLRINEFCQQAGLGRRLPTRLLGQSYRAAMQALHTRHAEAFPGQVQRP